MAAKADVVVIAAGYDNNSEGRAATGPLICRSDRTS